MKITLGNFSLADGGDSSPEDLRINGRNHLQIAGFLRAAAVSPMDRGNVTNTISFACTREHASCESAASFLFAHAAAMPWSGDVTITTEEFEGGVVRYFARASAARGREGTQRGITTRHVYTLECAQITGGSLGLGLGVGNPTGGPIQLY